MARMKLTDNEKSEPHHHQRHRHLIDSSMRHDAKNSRPIIFPKRSCAWDAAVAARVDFPKANAFGSQSAICRNVKRNGNAFDILCILWSIVWGASLALWRKGEQIQ